MARKKTLSELQLAEIKYRTLLEKRDRYNAEARAIREERDLLNQKKGDLRREMNSLRERRSDLLKEVRQHKERRNDLQRRAKELIQVKRELRDKVRGNVETEIQRLRDRIGEMETRQETTPLTLEQEERLLKDLREARQELSRVEAIALEHQDVLRQVGEIDTAIDEFFKQAEVEHQELVRKSEEAQALQEQIAEKMESLALLVAEANRVHDAFMAVKEKADHYHRRAVEMRQKIVSIKRSRRQEYEEARRILQEHKEEVRKVLDDEEAVERAIDDAIAILKKKGRLEL
jgi:uncharacterized coiled-coil DUF342 family protein